jgi:hypothetical protein
MPTYFIYLKETKEWKSVTYTEYTQWGGKKLEG